MSSAYQSDCYVVCMLFAQMPVSMACSGNAVYLQISNRVIGYVDRQLSP